MSERDDARELANKILSRPNADPVDDLAILSRALVRALQLLLDAVDYQSGACRMSELVGAVLPVEILGRARTEWADAQRSAEGVRRRSAVAPQIAAYGS
jgi:hypothetical protein